MKLEVLELTEQDRAGLLKIVDKGGATGACVTGHKHYFILVMGGERKPLRRSRICTLIRYMTGVSIG
jgi:hypothetical protein